MPTVIRFLGRHQKWACLVKAKDLNKAYGEPFYLDAWPGGKKGKSGAKVTSMTTSEGRKEWWISPRPQPIHTARAPEPLSTELPTRPLTADVNGKRNRDQDEDKEDRLAVLAARIESLRRTRKICRDE